MLKRHFRLRADSRLTCDAIDFFFAIRSRMKTVVLFSTCRNFLFDTIHRTKRQSIPDNNIRADDEQNRDGIYFFKSYPIYDFNTGIVENKNMTRTE